MTIIPVTLPTASSFARFKKEGSARLVNCYAEQTGNDAKAPWTLYPNSGLDLWTTVSNSGTVAGATGVRAMLATDDYLYVVAGRDITAIDTLGAQTLIDTLPADGDVYLASNRRSPTPEVALVSDGVGYLITGTSIATITDADLPAPTSVGVIDGYFLFPTTADRTFISEEDDGGTISALMYGKAQKQPDQTLLAIGGERDAVIFGERTIEWWTNSPDGSGNFPFVPVANINLGCLSAKTVVQLDRAIAWIGNDRTVRLMDGYSGQRISDHTVERDIAAASGTIQGFGYNDISTGHAWLVWTCDVWTWAYNLRTGRWNELKSFRRANWRGCQAVMWGGICLVGDYEDGRIYQVDANVAREGGEPILMSAIVPVIHSAPYGMRVNALFVDAVPGVGTTPLAGVSSTAPVSEDVHTWDGSWTMDSHDFTMDEVMGEIVITPREDPDGDPVLMVSTSTDGGQTFGAERRIELGPGGQHIRRLKTYRLGAFGPGGCTVKLSCSAAVSRAISGLAVDADRMSA